jgi:hypothetical protein
MATAAQPYWTGFLKLWLVTIAVRLYSATSPRRSPRKRRGGARKLPEIGAMGSGHSGPRAQPASRGAVPE